jgi:hypothetical protein
LDVNRNRYLSLLPTNAGQLTALRITLVDPPDGLAACRGATFWVGPPAEFSELSGLSDATPPTFVAARTGDHPYFHDWGAVGPFHVFGREIMPGAGYRLEAITSSCQSIGAPNFSLPLTVRTGRWGDVAGRCFGAACAGPDGLVELAFDVAAVLDKFVNRPGAPGKTLADLEPDVPDQQVNITDVMRAVDAYRGWGYPFAGPAPCE